jgi:hypothetical protein
VIGYANHLLVGLDPPAGLCLEGRDLDRSPVAPDALAAGGAAGLVTSRAFPAGMVDGNADPRSMAPLAYAAAEVGLVLAAEPAARHPLWPVLVHDRRVRPGRAPARTPLAVCEAGLAAMLLSGRDPAAGAKPQALGPQQPPKAA